MEDNNFEIGPSKIFDTKNFKNKYEEKKKKAKDKSWKMTNLQEFDTAFQCERYKQGVKPEVRNYK